MLNLYLVSPRLTEPISYENDLFKLLSSEDALITLIFQKPILAQHFTTSLKYQKEQIVLSCRKGLEGLQITKPLRDIAVPTIFLNVCT